MRLRLPLPVLVLSLIAGCGGAPTPEPAEANPTPAPVASSPEPAEPEEAEPQPEPKPDPAAEKLKADWVKLEGLTADEKARWTPELEAQTEKLVTKKYWNVDQALKAALASPHRYPGNGDRDSQRHPAETLKFFGLKLTSHVLEVGGGAGWYTEILAPVLSARGKLYVTSRDWKGDKSERATYYGQRFKDFVDKSKALGGKIELVVIDRQDLDLGLEEQVDLAIAMREIHNWHRFGQRVPHNMQQVFKALKPGGSFGVVQHRAKPGANPDESAKQGYLPEAWVIEQAEKAGFELAAKSEINANPKDTTDHPEGVWTLPPGLRLGDKDRDKYVAIGESDRMTLRFVKPKG